MTFIIKSSSDYIKESSKYEIEIEKNRLRPLLKYKEDVKNSVKINRLIRFIDRHNNFPDLTAKLLIRPQYIRLNLLALLRFFDRQAVQKFTYTYMANCLDIPDYNGRYTLVRFHAKKLERDGLIFINSWITRNQGVLTQFATAWGITRYIMCFVLYKNTGNLKRNIPAYRLEEMRQYMIRVALQKKYKTISNKNLYLNKVDWINEHLKRNIKSKA